MVLKIKRPVREEPNVQHMLERMPKKVADSIIKWMFGAPLASYAAAIISYC